MEKNQFEKFASGLFINFLKEDVPITQMRVKRETKQ